MHAEHYLSTWLVAFIFNSWVLGVSSEIISKLYGNAFIRDFVLVLEGVLSFIRSYWRILTLSN